ncbi:hypothetical protein C7475_101504 [Chitinophaga sp. S165]|nr:hypothetical protein C7475_101504 [Chitinophaga sp. S165]
MPFLYPFGDLIVTLYEADRKPIGTFWKDWLLGLRLYSRDFRIVKAIRFVTSM